MTSRVQKGSTVFRPVAKSRGRTAPSSSRQPSVAVDQSQSQSSDVALFKFSAPTLPTAASTAQEQTATTIDLEPEPTISSAPSGSGNTANYTTPEPQFIQPPDPTTPPPIRSATPIVLRSGPAVPTVISRPSAQPPPREPRPAIVPQNSSDPNNSPSIMLTTPTQTTELLEAEPSPTLVAGTSTNVTDNNKGASSSQDTAAQPGLLSNSGSIPSRPENEEQQANAPTKPPRKRQTLAGEGSKKPKRRRSASGDVENFQDGVTSKKQPRASSSTPRARKRAPSPPPYDPDADPGEDIDPTTVTMASLCSDTGQGRVSNRAAEILINHAAWKVKNREKRARMKQLMEAKKYGREDDDPEANPEQEQSQTNSLNEAGSSAPTNTPAIVDQSGGGFDYSQDLATSRYNVQVRIGPNGETVIDEESLVVDRVENDGTANYTHVIESDHTKFVNSGSYGKRYRGSRWSAEETELFYDALAQYGENYELIAYVLPGRDRKSCKNKFKVEDKRNHVRINHCLNNSIPVDMKTLSRMTGKDFSGPVPEIRVPTPMATIPPPDQETSDLQNNESQRQVKMRSRSKSRGIVEAGVVVLGDAENFDNNFDKN